MILLTNLDSGSGAAIIGASKAQGVTMIDYDRLTLKGDADYYVSGDATEAGRLQGQGLVDDLEKAGTKSPAIAMLHGAPTDSFATDLHDGLQGGPEAEARLRRVHARGRAGGAELGRSAGAHDLRADAPEDRQQDRRRRRRERHARQLRDLGAAGPRPRPRARHRARCDRPGGAAHPRRRAVDDRLLLDQGSGDQGREPGGPDRARREAHRHRHERRQRDQGGPDDLPQAGDDHARTTSPTR